VTGGFVPGKSHCAALHSSSTIVWCLSVRTCLPIMRGRMRGSGYSGFARNHLELIRTRELLLRQLPSPPAVVLDVGGGTGVHATWLAGRGYSVHLVDLVSEHVRAAAEDGLVTAEVGDARRLTQADASVDAVLLLGPRYHLVSVRDPFSVKRRKAFLAAIWQQAQLGSSRL
jgi:SAM-dependent methyltransferase